MSAAVKSVLSVSAMIVAITAMLALTASRADPGVPPPLPDVPRSPSKNLIIAFDAAQKAWTLEPNADTAWTRAEALETLSGSEIAASAWDDYLQLDSSSLRAREVRRRRRQKVVTVAPHPPLATELDLTVWAQAVLSGERERGETCSRFSGCAREGTATLHW